MATAFATPEFSIDNFLKAEREKDLFRFSTAGSVDDGKSTLIGRLLYDTQSVYEDQLRSIEGKGTVAAGQIDFALLTDGLRAEREQGITIDVAYRYFSTSRRKFIIADTPGHEQYTRNMATGASTADATVVLLDARRGVLVQSRRHAYIASLLRVRHVLVAVNKMDLVGYKEEVFQAIKRDYQAVLDEIAVDTGNPVEARFLPVSALAGDNVVHRSSAMPWYDGPSLLELLESLPATYDTRHDPFRFAVQRVVRPDLDFRGFAGQIASGSIRKGELIHVLPSNKKAHIQRIVTWDGDLEEAQAPLSITLTLDEEIDISRGDLFTSEEATASVVTAFNAALVWMNQLPLEVGKRYLLKQNSQTVPAIISQIHHRIEISTLERLPAASLEMNSIGTVSVQLFRPLAVDAYADNRRTGSAVLIDPLSNATVGAMMILSVETNPGPPVNAAATIRPGSEERAARWGNLGAIVEVAADKSKIDLIERALFERGNVAVRLARSEFSGGPSESTLAQLIDNGLLVLLTEEAAVATVSLKTNGHFLELTDESTIAESTLSFLTGAGVLLAPGKVLSR